MTTLFTIGYEQATSAAVLDELKRNGVELIADVRAVAASRRPGFSKRQLAAGLDGRGIGYIHFQKLGTPKEGREAARSGRACAFTSASLQSLKRARSLTRSRRWCARAARSACSVTSATPTNATAAASPNSCASGWTRRPQTSLQHRPSRSR